MADILQEFSENFSLKLVAAYEELYGKDIAPKACLRLNSALIFAALESCRGLCGNRYDVPLDQIWCRFTLGKVSNHEKEELRTLLNRIRCLNLNLPQAPKQLSEFAFDFSMSTMRLSDGYSSDEPIPARPFRFLVIAESELKRSEDEVMKDLLRLIAASSPLKIMVYNAWNADLGPRLRQVLGRCCTLDGDYQKAPWRADWLFLGVPTYSDWRKAGGDKTKLRRQIHYLRSGAKTIELEDGNAWWNWEAKYP